jgi:hypothetical protein
MRNYLFPLEKIVSKFIPLILVMDIKIIKVKKPVFANLTPEKKIPKI